jgi:DNA-binding NarL/FixJ family response regulator
MLRKVKVLIADDHPIISEGVKKLVEELPDMEVSGVVNNGRELVERAKNESPDLISYRSLESY